MSVAGANIYYRHYRLAFYRISFRVHYRLYQTIDGVGALNIYYLALSNYQRKTAAGRVVSAV